ncbi:DNA-3-methyladenine glycosylase [Yersinia massiliensis]|uniref:DNA-3-methyladenine glycosylase II n=1 Tax=Yersinia massiliensis TaxID=419257 RepID=A0A2R4NP02_9GAMM|nr:MULTISPECIES: DNA-3-methyladenine glycosylase [Yersinia]HEC1648591.1 DNA-3-methyladenine glycosylase 2 family protein [Yersinia enterocolitica]ATM86293.1 DNA-3-methyladenine glycosylase 2 family protein [Yersinia frederiksenii]AVX37847.1 DNA-3-methyladenine glycosylase 2 family protein [Yersinia massiliensis]MCB5306562.1 DNA-3-methyladenine glycosylase [Yersinia massiliensis]MCB5317260.1 DNA-3-methyladenine glycosylase [Yersinia massiliensis]
MFYSYGETEINHLKRRDKKMAAAIDRLGMLARPLSPDLFAALIRNIVDQQISVKAALTVNARLVALLGTVTPMTVAAASAEAIQGCGMTMRKAGYIKGAAEAALNGSLDLSAIAQLPDNDVIAQLSSLNGVGVWTAEMLLISSLCRPDVLSWGDLAIRRGMMNLYRHKTLPRERFERYRRRYAPYGTTASLYLWALSNETE